MHEIDGADLTPTTLELARPPAAPRTGGLRPDPVRDLRRRVDVLQAEIEEAFRQNLDLQRRLALAREALRPFLAAVPDLAVLPRTRGTCNLTVSLSPTERAQLAAVAQEIAAEDPSP